MRMRWKKRRDEGASRSDLARHNEIASNRLRDVLAREYDYGDQDPKEVEARLRNMVYGTNRK
jgi:lambda repressor-like predicted transcriptional regulator